MAEEKEIYRPINYLKFGDFYDVSNFGNIRSNYNKRVLTKKKITINIFMYLYQNLLINMSV